MIAMDEKTIVNKAKDVMFGFKVKLSANARFLYVALLVAENEFLTHTELSEITDIKSPVTLRKAIKELKENGFIEVTRTKYGQIYKVL